MAVEVVKDEKKTLVVGKGIAEYYFSEECWKESVEFSQEVLEICKQTSMFKNCQKNKET